MIGTAALRSFVSRLRHSSAKERALVASCLSDSLGTGLFMAMAATYFTRTANLEPTQFALGLSLAGLVGFVFTIPMGLIGDRFGTRRTLIAINLWRAVGISTYVFVSSFATYVVIVLVTAVADRTAGAISQALVADSTDKEERPQLMALIRSVRNVGYAVGGLAASIAIAFANDWLYRGMILGVSLFFVLCAALLQRLPERRATDRRQRERRRWAFKDREYMAFTGLNTLMSLHITTLNVLLPLWILSAPGIPNSFAAIPLTINTVVVSLCQIPATRHVISVVAAGKATLGAGAGLAAATLFIAGAAWPANAGAAIPLLLCGVLALTAAEMLQSAASWQFSVDLAPEDNRTQYIATFYLGGTVERILGPVALAALILAFRSWGWVALGTLFLLGGIATWVLARRHAAGPPVPLPGRPTEPAEPAEPTEPAKPVGRTVEVAD
ncbi:MFS transporter [Streptomyces sp. NPDC005576]|uniref:MFS transporter n=1 Tax=unclassified Streptomyces TaxID=2593676 RepID=UPI003405D688